MNRFFIRLGKVLAIAAMLGILGSGVAMAQAEPTVDQIYQAAKAGKVDQAQVMVQQVLVKHPNSAKAHFVQAELFARQGQLSRARESLATADKLAPGLPFANSEAIQTLRAQLANKPVAQAPSGNAAGSGAGSSASRAVAPVQASASGSGFPVGLGLALGGAAIALVIFLTRRKAAPPVYNNPTAGAGAGASGNGLSGPQTFGSAAVAPSQAAYPQAYGQPQYGQPGYPQQPAAGSGMGGRIAGGLATGLAVGAGVMAAEAIGRNMMGNNAHAATPTQPAFNNGGSEGNTFAGNQDMGGNDFGIGDASSWDDGGSGSDGGGGDWDT